jgi:hypothetical protein
MSLNYDYGKFGNMYNRLDGIGGWRNLQFYKHQVIIHQENFVDPDEVMIALSTHKMWKYVDKSTE